ncbi:MAG: hypothetical protein AAGJ82_09555 [Bacteroidota bacterium]
MSNNYNIRLNPEEPSREDIQRRMDFGALLEQFEQPATAPPPREAKLRSLPRLAYVLGAAAAVALLVLFLPGLLRETQLTPETYFAQQDYVHPPLAQLEQSFQVRTVSHPHQGGIIEYPSGSKVVIPAAAFMNDRGNIVGGEVKLFYRELHDYIDFFVGGIPMDYDSLGYQRYLTSAGMVEVYAEKNGERLSLAPGKALQVELVSEVTVDNYFSLPNYFVYQLDTINRTWRYRNVDMMQFVEEDHWTDEEDNTPAGRWRKAQAQLDVDYQQALQDLQLSDPLPAAPIAPTKADGNSVTFELDFQNGDLAIDSASELQAQDLDFLHEGTIWEIAPESQAINLNALRVNWESVRLKKLANQRYELVLVHPENEETLIVAPVLLGEKFTAAKRTYEAEKAAYDAAVQAREDRLADSRMAIRQTFDQRKADLQNSLATDLQSDAGPLKRKIINRFVVGEFGIYNCAQPIDAPRTVTGMRYRTTTGDELENVTAYVVNPAQNTIYRYLANEAAPLGVPTDERDNILWIVDKEGNISRTTLPGQQDGDAEIALEKVAPPVQSAKELRRVLSL